MVPPLRIRGGWGELEMRKCFYNNLGQKTRRKELRKNQTDAEKILWFYLRRHSLEGLKFFRQYGVGPYILDFYCPQIRFGIEVDGGQHAENRNVLDDKRRMEFLEKENIKILRFWNDEILKQKEAVIEKIREFIIKNK